jgi:hypothetical protein
LAKDDSRDDFVSDPIGYADFASNLEDRLDYLVEEVQALRYRPRHLINVDVPKSGLSVRPGNVLPIDESVVLHAIVYVLAPALDKQLSDNVYSYRLHPEWEKKAKKRRSIFRDGEPVFPFLKRRTIRLLDPFESWYEAWPRFVTEAAAAQTSEGYTHLTKTDITSYFENIDLDMLEGQIRRLLKRDGESKVLHVLFRILRGWTRTTSAGTVIARGLPQGNNASSFLANLYLIPLDLALDAFCQRNDATWFRYVDDVKIFSKTERVARETVFAINRALRSLHLNLQGSKTKVLSGPKLKKELDTREEDGIGAAFDAVKGLKPTNPDDSKKITRELKGLRETVSKFTQGLPHSVAKLTGSESRIFRRLMTLYGHCGRTQLVKPAFAALRRLPEYRVLVRALRYLSRMPYKHHDDIAETLLTMLEGSKLPFPYQEAQVLQQLIYFHPRRPEPIASRIRTYAFGRRRNWLVRQKALEAMATYPYRRDHAASVSRQHLSDNHFWVRRAACLLALRADAEFVRGTFDKLVFHPDPRLSRIALYFSRLMKDATFAKQESERLTSGSHTDTAIVHNLPRLYTMVSSEREEIRELVKGHIKGLKHSRSQKIRWHAERLARRVAAGS